MAPMITTIHQLSKGKGVRLLLDEDLTSHVVRTAITTIEEWLHFPNEHSITRAQAKLVHFMVKVTGSWDILLLDSIWHAYIHPHLNAFETRQQRTIKDSNIQVLFSRIEALPVTQPLSSEQAELKHIGEICLPCGAIGHRIMTDRITRAAEDFIQFIRKVWPAINSNHASPEDTELIKTIKNKLDFYLPFRESAPSHMQITSHLGPFEETYIRTRGGLFSALIYRGITYASEADKDNHSK
ncbi:hypothetical protein K439DRAFT_1614206 [Ramaria rubella]|nr:hypothetical protein K439DRAFT_1614206 [Ramaria rubella]